MANIQCKKGISTKLTAHFRSTEFDCKGNGCCAETVIDRQLLEYLEQLRMHFKHPLIINSGYRCQKHNQTVGGSAKSYHTKGMAADIRIPGFTSREVAAVAEELGIPGIGLYETKEDGYFVHIDTRPGRTRWYGQKQEKREKFSEQEGEYDMKLRTLSYGSKGKDVIALQILLIAHGYHCGKGAPDGIFGPNTQLAVKEYQKDHDLASDGIAGSKTMAKLLGVTPDE